MGEIFFASPFLFLKTNNRYCKKHSYKLQYYENLINEWKQTKMNCQKVFHSIARQNTINNAVFHAWIVIDMHQGYSVHARFSLIILFPYCFFSQIDIIMTSLTFSTQSSFYHCFMI